MRKTRIFAIPLIGVLLILGACASPATTPAPASTTPAPASTTPAPAPATPAPAPATPAPTTPAPAPATGPAAFTTSALTVAPVSVDFPGEKVTVSVTVTNTGGQSGTYKVVLKIQNDETKTEDIKTQDVTLAGGASQRVIFTILAGPKGAYTVIIDKLSGVLQVALGM